MELKNILELGDVVLMTWKAVPYNSSFTAPCKVTA